MGPLPLVAVPHLTPLDNCSKAFFIMAYRLTMCNCCGQVFDNDDRPLDNVLLKLPGGCGDQFNGLVGHKGSFSKVQRYNVRFKPVHTKSSNIISH